MMKRGGKIDKKKHFSLFSRSCRSQIEIFSSYIKKSVNEYWMEVAIAVNQKSEIMNLWVHFDTFFCWWCCCAWALVCSQMNEIWLPVCCSIRPTNKLLIVVITSVPLRVASKNNVGISSESLQSALTKC